MKKIKLLTLILVMLSTLGLNPPAEAARTCRAKITLPVPELNTCDVDTNNPVYGNPFAYIDPTQGCDFSFSLPGMPSLSLEGISTTLCNQLQQLGQAGINEVLGPILEKIPSNLSYSLEDSIRGMFEDTQYLQENWCPQYADDGTLLSYECSGTDQGIPDNTAPDWATGIVDNNNVDESCYTYNGRTFCEDNDKVNGTDDSTSSTIPVCSELDSLIDSNGNIIECTSGRTQKATSGSAVFSEDIETNDNSSIEFNY